MAPKPAEESTQLVLKDSTAPVLVDFLSTVPAPLTAVLVSLRPAISTTRYVLEVVSWKRSWYDSWLALAVWWALCLLSLPVLRYLLPVTAVLVIALSKRKTTSLASTPVTEQALQAIIADLETIRTLLPSRPAFPALPSVTAVLRVCIAIYLPYLAFTHLASFPTLLGLAGTLVLTIRAPWARVIRRTLWSSAHIRWICYKFYSKVSGSPVTPPKRPVTQLSATSEPNTSIRFLFTIYENQRWWMGLDWTAALLPSERPSWCSAAHQPVSPPNAFALPAETSIVMKDSKDKSVKRTARWEWEDGEWKVMAKRDAGGAVTRIDRPFLHEKEEKGSDSGSRLSRAASKFRDRSASSLGGGIASEEALHDHSANDEHGEREEEADEEPRTDPDGWIYGDNKWIGMSNKGGIGKYTRYRRWTRVAVLKETVEEVGSNGIPSHKQISATEDRTPAQSPIPAPESSIDEVSAASDERQGIRQRLRAASGATS